MSTHDETPIERDGEPTSEPDRVDDTGSVERYVRLHEFIEQLQQDTSHADSEPFPTEDADAYHMAAFLRAVAPGASDPDPEFLANLQTRLLAEANNRGAALPDSSSSPSLSPVAGERAEPRHVSPRPVLSRRLLLGAGLGAAAAVGVATGAQIERLSNTPPPTSHPVALVPSGSGAWIAVASVTNLPLGQVKRFETDFVIGFVRHTAAGFSAISGSCTHMGCLLLWNASDRTFDCPCHGGRFTEQGNSAPGSPFAYQPLPSIQTKVEDGQVWVYVIPSEQNQPSPAGGATPAATTKSGGGYAG